MARDRITLRVDEELRNRIEAVRERMAATTRPGQRAPTLSDAARHCIELGLAAATSGHVPPVPPPMNDATNPSPVAMPTPRADPTPVTRSWLDDFDADD